MTRILETAPPSIAAPDSSGAIFGRSADGMLVALVGEHAFAMVPARDGRHYLASGWRIRRPMAEWVRLDFYGHSGEIADEPAFRAKVAPSARSCDFGQLAERCGNTAWRIDPRNARS